MRYKNVATIDHNIHCSSLRLHRSINLFCSSSRRNLLYIYKNIGFPTEAEYPYFSADFILKIFL